MGLDTACDLPHYFSMSINQSQRTFFIVSEFKSGKTLQEIGDVLSISRERVRQILDKNGVRSSDGGASLKSRKLKEKKISDKDSKIWTRHGCSAKEYYSISPEIRKLYSWQEKNAKSRGIAWFFTPVTWLDCWLSSGKFDLRGKGSGYCMARKGDVGPYSTENVYFCTCGENISDAWKNKDWRHKIKLGWKKKVLAND